MEQLEHERERSKHHSLLGATFLTDSGANILRSSGRKSIMRASRPSTSTFTMEFEVDDDCPPPSDDNGADNED